MTILLVFLAMCIKDVASNASVYLVSRGHGLWAGITDGLSDIAAVLSIGVTAVITVDHGLSWFTIAVFAALVAGSVLGGVLGTRLGKHIDTQLGGSDGSDRGSPLGAPPAR